MTRPIESAAWKCDLCGGEHDPAFAECPQFPPHEHGCEEPATSAMLKCVARKYCRCACGAKVFAGTAGEWIEAWELRSWEQDTP